MTWNYRVIKKVYKGTDYEEDSYSIHEVYYNKDGSISSWSIDPISIHGTTPEELKDDYEKYGEAFNKPILNWDELEAMIERRETNAS